MSKIRFFFVRHGQTQANIEHKVQGWSNTCLTELGQLQALKTAEKLKNIPFDRAYCGDGQRHIRTAEIIIGENVNREKCAILLEPYWREAKLGGYQNKSIDNMYKAIYQEMKCEHAKFSEILNCFGYKGFMDRLAKYDETGECENYNSIKERIYKAMNRVIEENKCGVNILIVSSTLTLAALVVELLDKKENITMNNCAITKIEYENGQYSLVSFNE